MSTYKRSAMRLFLAFGLFLSMSVRSSLASANEIPPETALLQAIDNRDTAAIRTLLEQGVNVNARDKTGSTALMRAAEWGRTNVVRLLLDRGADATAKDGEGQTALNYAVMHTLDIPTRDLYAIFRKLLAHGADPNAGRPVLYDAIYERTYPEAAKLRLARLLLEHGAEADPDIGNLWTVLMEVTRENHLKLVRLLLDHGADINARRQRGKPTFDILGPPAVPNRVFGTVTTGTTALLVAVRNDHVAMTKLLLDRGADANIPAEYGWTALMEAVQNVNVPIVKMLLAKGANVNAKDDQGLTALRLALGSAGYITEDEPRSHKNRRHQIADLLKAAGARE
jgi:ankyrin repeat protein